MQAVNIRQSCDLSGSACHREHGLDFVRFAAVDHGLAGFLVKRVDDHFDFSVGIQVKDVTETHPNTFPRLPVREDATVFVWFSRFPDREAYERSATAVTEAMRERELTTKLAELTREPPEVLLLSPTDRSLL